HGLVHGQGDAPDRRLMYRPVVLIGPRGVGKEPRDARVHFTAPIGHVVARHRGDPLCEFLGTLRQVLGHVVQHLSAIVAARLRPSVGGVRRFHGVPNVFAVPFGDFGEESTRRSQDFSTVALIGAHLCAADEQLVGAVDGRDARCEVPVLMRAGCAFFFFASRIPLPASRFTYSHIPSFPPSRPNPDSRYPPNPVAASNKFVQLIHTTPALIFGATSSARLMFSVQTLAGSP